MLNVRKNAYKNESMLTAYWRLKREKSLRQDDLMIILVGGFGILMAAGAFAAILLSPIAHF